MNWMSKWVGGFPLFVASASGNHFSDVDGHSLVDFCLGDTGAMAGHSPPEVKIALSKHLETNGVTLMLPTEDAIAAGEELQKRFGMRFWQFSTSATDANRFALRICRAITKRKKILVFNYCYHGTVDESFATIDAETGRTTARRGNLGPPVALEATTKVVEFNDLKSLEISLQERDVAAVLAEPAMTNIGIILPDEGFHTALRELTRKYGTLLIIDETHTLCAGYGGYTKAFGLTPDFVTIGKAIGGGIPCGAYGFSADVAERLEKELPWDDCDVAGIGGTLAGNALSMTAIRVTLSSVLTEVAFDRMIRLAERFAKDCEFVIKEFRLPWIVKRLGCRVEFWFRELPPRNGTEAAAAVDAELDRYIHVAELNRGILLTPFHNMALMCPQTTEEDIGLHAKVFRECIAALFE